MISIEINFKYSVEPVYWGAFFGEELHSLEYQWKPWHFPVY